MLVFLNNHTGVLCAAAVLLLLLCLLLLICLLRRQKRLYQEQAALTNQQFQELAQHSAALDESLGGRLRDESARQQQLQLSAASDAVHLITQRIDTLGARLDTSAQMQETRLHRISSTLDERLAANDQRSELLRASLSESLDKLQKDNAEKLEKMRQTVDEKLHETLNRRLGESFSLVNERLEQVYKGLGEMQTLANGVGDLKRVLSNVKSRGIWGEVQLGALLEQMLSPGQYAANVQVVPNTAKRVEYAVCLPGNHQGQAVYLPIDSKFPIESYERVLAAADAGDTDQLSAANAELCAAIRTEAKRIAEKYIAPPYTTDFAVMFLSTEGLYAEALRSRGLMEELQQKYRILVAGPSTLSALLNSLQVGFRSLAIEQRSSEVWQLLGAVKTEFSRFSDLLDQTQQRLRQAGETIEKAAVRTRAINRRLRDVEMLEGSSAQKLLDTADEERAAQ